MFNFDVSIEDLMDVWPEAIISVVEMKVENWKVVDLYKTLKETKKLMQGCWGFQRDTRLNDPQIFRKYFFFLDESDYIVFKLYTTAPNHRVKMWPKNLIFSAYIDKDV